ncbi:MAG: secondary thiamine-phosphate synthase enzyme YjbQ [Candidatus Bipolaricaulota bacterium]|nr:secondary thiamine-phosphate synthase enzyme YjbQ [Candidatus Bipolaricaulota bacterium]
MAISRLSVQLAADGGMADITGQVQAEVKKAGLKEGIVAILLVGSTGAITTIEYEPGLVKQDLPQAMERIAPTDIPYEHHKRWGDDNGRGHVRASIMGPSLVVPFSDGNLTLGTWQQVVAINWDTRARSREIVLQIMGK